jgi:hypothetical protein
MMRSATAVSLRSHGCALSSLTRATGLEQVIKREREPSLCQLDMHTPESCHRLKLALLLFKTS